MFGIYRAFSRKLSFVAYVHDETLTLYFSGVNYYLSCWYKRREFGIRAAIFVSQPLTIYMEQLIYVFCSVLCSSHER